jgi:hypothetical protein
MKKVFIPFVLDGGYLIPYSSHELFSGKVHTVEPSRLPMQNADTKLEVPICEVTKCREFVSTGELMQAISDYRQKFGDKAKAFESFFIHEKISL